MKKWKLLGKRAAAFLLGAVMAVNPGLAGTAAESLLVESAGDCGSACQSRNQGDLEFCPYRFTGSR